MNEDQTQRYALHPQTIEMLVCPLTKTRLTLNGEKTELISRAAKVAYPIRAGVPLLSLEESRTLTNEEYDALEE